MERWDIIGWKTRDIRKQKERIDEEKSRRGKNKKRSEEKDEDENRLKNVIKK